jgi:hypothetical protein
VRLADVFAAAFPDLPATAAAPRARFGGAAGAVSSATCAGFSRTTSRGRLSSRNPWNDGCRNVPSRVHSVNDTSPTSCGLTQCARRASAPVGGFAKGGSSAASAASCDDRRFSVASSKPVPTLPK